MRTQPRKTHTHNKSIQIKTKMTRVTKSLSRYVPRSSSRFLLLYSFCFLFSSGVSAWRLCVKKVRNMFLRACDYHIAVAIRHWLRIDGFRTYRLPWGSIFEAHQVAWWGCLLAYRLRRKNIFLDFPEKLIVVDVEVSD